MARVTVCRGDWAKMNAWAYKQSGLKVSTPVIREMLGIKPGKLSDRLVLSMRDSDMIKCLRCGRKVILLGDHNTMEQLERIDMVLHGQGEIDGAKYNWKLREF
jgi:hypothetical protein